MQNGSIAPKTPASVCYRIVHRTEYRYSEPVAVCHNQLRMRPQTNGHIRCDSCDVRIAPLPDDREYHIDYFGNGVDSFAIEALHDSLVVVVQSDVCVAGRDEERMKVSPPWKDIVVAVRESRTDADLSAKEYIFPSSRIPREPRFSDYAMKSFQSHGMIVDALMDLTKRIHADFRYDINATNVKTTTQTAFELRAGVCQDFTHIGIACLRSIGVPARYISGYLRTRPRPGQARLFGSDQSHAWLSAFCGPDLGWVHFDPTNACLCQTDHIPVCVGRDYDDVSPMRGIVIGGGATTLSVSVDVEEKNCETPMPH